VKIGVQPEKTIRPKTRPTKT